MLALTRTCTCSDPVTPTGSVATLARAASALPGSGAESLRGTAVHGPHRPEVLLRTVTLTPRAAAASGKPTPTTSASPVARVSRLSTVPVPLVVAAPVVAALAAAAGATATGAPAGMGTLSTEGRTACGAAPTETTGPTTALVASKVDTARMRTVLMARPRKVR